MTLAFGRRSVSCTVLCFALSILAIAAQTPATTSNADAKDDPLQRPRPEKKKGRKTEDAYKKWLNEVKLIITPEEEAAFRKLSNDSERANYIELFWQRRDPTPDTSENEYQDEFYRRLAYADEHFSAGKAGRNTDRGRMYILHGPPDSVEAHPMGGPYLRPADQGGGQTETFPFEIWRYRHLDGIGQEIEIEFVDTCNCGDYHSTLDPGEKDAMAHVPGAGLTDLEAMQGANKADRFRSGFDTLGSSLFGANRESKEFDKMMTQALLEAPPAVKAGSREDVRVIMRYNLLPFNLRIDFVKAATGTDMVPITFQVANKDLTYENKNGVQRASVNVYGRFTTLTGKVVQAFEEPLRLNVPENGIDNFLGSTSLYQELVPLHPGRYRLDVVLKDVIGDRTGIWSRGIEVPNFSEGEGLMSSTLILADSLEPAPANQIGKGSFVLGNLRVRPRLPNGSNDVPAFRQAEKMNAWLEAYNFRVDPIRGSSSALVEYEVTDAAKAKVYYSSEDMESSGSQITIKKQVPLEKLTPGSYELKLTVKDQTTGQEIERVQRFTVK